MKQFAFTLIMIAGFLTGCSTDDLTAVNPNSNDINPTLVTMSDPSGNCIDAGALGGSAVLSSYTGQQITFNWNNAVDFLTNGTYVSHIEIIEDAACPAPVYGSPVAATYSIDVVNSSSLVVPAGVSAKCFKWRIVINGYVDGTLNCTTITEWKDATYVQ